MTSGDYRKALEYHNKALEIDEGLNDRVSMARDYWSIGDVYSNTGDHDKALELRTKALGIKRLNLKLFRLKIFVSYSRRDAGDFADQIQKYFSTFNYDVFTDTNSINVGDVWSSVIDINISKVRYLCCFNNIWFLA